jgi:ATP-dependent exoDNAse (exonuclease V) beta subunit
MAEDARARRDALDPLQSFIVQAPAGSGKTELLIQRYLRLLACVGEPEEVLAITFTRKAAGEMRNRVIKALHQAEAGKPPHEPHLLQSYELAAAVLADPHRRHWQLHRHPARLAISTIDAVNAWLAGRAPFTAGNTALHRVTEQPRLLYEQAAHATLELLGEDGPEAECIARLLTHLDNDAARLVRLLALMLPRREQWLRHIPRGSERTRTALEAPVRALCESVLRRLARLLPDEMSAELPALLSAAAGELAGSDPNAPLLVWHGHSVMPAPVAVELPRWRALADVLLTKNGEWRRTLNKAQGFPPASPMKQRLLALLAVAQRTPGLQEALDDARTCPDAAYSETEWDVLHALVEVLPLAAAELRLVFAAQGLADFAEVAADALNALGRDGHPSELGLALDYRVRHILVDEFQDTSSVQFELLGRLVAGWQPGDGRTLFLVGDPMQSIYRFREAEVRLFNMVRDEGVGDVRPHFLRLQANFRSDAQLVGWANAAFAAVFPVVDDAIHDWVEFVPSLPALTADPEARVELHWSPVAALAAEGQAVAAVVADCRQRWPDESIGVLVRSRSHAVGVIAALRNRGIGFVAPDLESLEGSPVAQDLLALTRALGHAADRLAWLAVLRAPWCGLSLADMERLAGADHQSLLWELMNDPARCAQLSLDGQSRLARSRECMARALELRGRRSLRDLVEGTWLALGGPATLTDPSELNIVDAFFQQLEAADEGGDCADLEAFTDALATRQATLAAGHTNVQIMTMHKAKGLQFDTVILPGLCRAQRRDERPVLLWHEVSMGAQGPACVLAPTSPSSGCDEPLYEFLWRMEQRKQIGEQDRLLYVACTRARRRLHLFASLNGRTDAKAEVVVDLPQRGSLLARLWPAVEPAAQRAARAFDFEQNAGQDAAGRAPRWIAPRIRRLHREWRQPSAPQSWQLPRAGAGLVGELVAYDWASQWARYAGSVAHRWLQWIAREGVERFDAERIEHLAPVFRRMLAELGATGTELDQATARVGRALRTAVSGARGRWILSSQHRAAASELALTLWDGGVFRQLILDRTFVAADGSRWIIDFKTSSHEGGNLDEFLRAESERHREQLGRYQKAMQLMGAERIRTALYFPLLEVLHEVSLD